MPDSRECHQLVCVTRHVPAVVVHQLLRGFLEVHRLLVVESYLFDHRIECRIGSFYDVVRVQACGEESARIFCYLEL